MANIIKETFNTTVEVAVVVQAAVAQAANVYNDGWDVVKDSSEWVKTNAEGEWKQAWSRDRASRSNRAVVEAVKEAYRGGKAKVVEAVSTEV